MQFVSVPADQLVAAFRQLGWTLEYGTDSTLRFYLEEKQFALIYHVIDGEADLHEVLRGASEVDQQFRERLAELLAPDA